MHLRVHISFLPFEQNEHTWLMKHVGSGGMAFVAKTWPYYSYKQNGVVRNVAHLGVAGGHALECGETEGSPRASRPYATVGFATA
jgi:hypothetical protein